MADEIEKSLRGLNGNEMKARIYSSDEELLDLIQKIGGPRTAASIRKAMKTSPRDRIPFLFSSLDPQLVIDVMANDIDEILREILANKKAGKPRP